MNTMLQHLANCPQFSDNRGKITQVIDSIPFSSVLLITCNKGAIRANHYHKDDYHVCLLTKGRMFYYERPLGSNSIPVKHVFSAGDVFYTPSLVEHCMEFLDDSEFWCFSRLSRSQENYEKDTTRLTTDLSKL